MPITPEQFAVVRRLVFDKAKIVLEPGKEYLVESRLAALARDEGMESVTALVAALRTKPTPTLERLVIDAMTTNETSWFRDAKPFDALRTSVLPALIERRASTRALVIWSLACSTGQEPYSITMLIREHFPDLAAWQLQIIAVDLSPTVVEKAKAGCYSQLDVSRGLPPSMLARFFDRDGANYRIKPDIRKWVSFREMNLAGPWLALPSPDVVFLRNVMIYLDVATRRSILAHVSAQLVRDGYLFLGAGETTLNLDPAFERIDCDRAGCFQLVSRPT